MLLPARLRPPSRPLSRPSRLCPASSCYEDLVPSGDSQRILRGSEASPAPHVPAMSSRLEEAIRVPRSQDVRGSARGGEEVDPSSRTLPHVREASLPPVTGISVLALGYVALVSPNVYSQTSKLDESRKGALLGLHNSVGSLGQFAGPAAGGVAVRPGGTRPYLLGGVLLLVHAASLPR